MAVDRKSSQTTQAPHVSPLRPGNPHRLIRFAGAAIILLAAAIAAAPILFHGPVGADDFEFHLISWIDAQHSWLHGIPYPHWAPSPNFGAGEPRFVFYPPLTWMLGAAIGLALPWTLVPFAMTFLLLTAAGFATRALARVALADAPATLAGCAAIFSFYTLFTAYDRTAFGEMAGGFWVPLLLLFALRDSRPGCSVWRRAFDGSAAPLAVVVAGAWLSDAPVGVMASYLLAAVALIAAVLARSWFPVVRASVAVVLGVALTGLYLIPAAWEQRWVDIQQATGAKGDPGLRIENNWLFPHHADPALHLRDLALYWISRVTVAMIGVALVSLVLVWRRNSMPRRLLIPLAIIPVAVLLLQLPFSLPLWNLLPKLRFLQFPWRWLLAVEAPMAIFFAAAVWPVDSRKRWLRPAVACVCALIFVGLTLFAEQNFFRDPKEDDDLATILDKANSGQGFVGTDEYAPAGAENSLVAMGLPDACLTDDFDDEQGVQPGPQEEPVWLPEQKSCIATASAAERQPEHLRVDMNDLRAGFIVLRLRRYPAWRIKVNGHVLTNLQSRDDGLISVPAPQGPAHVTVDWTTTPDVIAGRLVSCVALLGLVGLAWVERRRARPV
jgi:6-pyruvoyl-tetrahydropterin synthase related domain